MVLATFAGTLFTGVVTLGLVGMLALVGTGLTILLPRESEVNFDFVVDFNFKVVDFFLVTSEGSLILANSLGLGLLLPGSRLLTTPPSRFTTPLLEGGFTYRLVVFTRVGLVVRTDLGDSIEVAAFLITGELFFGVGDFIGSVDFTSALSVLFFLNFWSSET